MVVHGRMAVRVPEAERLLEELLQAAREASRRCQHGKQTEYD